MAVGGLLDPVTKVVDRLEVPIVLVLGITSGRRVESRATRSKLQPLKVLAKASWEQSAKMVRI
jgi:hypothetical protein